MKVKDMIERLSKFDPELEVLYRKNPTSVLTEMNTHFIYELREHEFVYRDERALKKVPVVLML